jgi:hypothetical protein
VKGRQVKGRSVQGRGGGVLGREHEAQEQADPTSEDDRASDPGEVAPVPRRVGEGGLVDHAERRAERGPNHDGEQAGVV